MASAHEADRGRWTREVRAWAISLALLAPAFVPYLLHFREWKPYARPTGYIQHDMPIYMAKAREYFDGGAFRPTYGNPCSPTDDAPRIYFQPWTLALGLVHHLTGLRPLVLFPLFWFLAAWACARAALALYREVVGRDDWAARRGLVLFFWGGGLLAIAGIVLGLATKGTLGRKDVVALDTFEGWWFLNFGRNLIYPTEALYHAFFFSCILSVLRRRFALATTFALLTAASTPFTGFELLAILWTWGFVEVVFLEDRAQVRRFFAATTALMTLFLGYMLGFLNLFAEHRAVAARMSLPWGYGAETFLPAYALVGALAAWRMRTLPRAAKCLAEPRNRLFLVWAVVAFALANHEFAVPMKQPIHFTRGYIWTALFFLGAPQLLRLLGRLRGRRLALAAFTVLFLFDNLTWFGVYYAGGLRAKLGNGVRINIYQEEVLRRLDDPRLAGCTILGDDHELLYLAIAETPLRSWVSHWIETVDFERHRDELDALFERGRFASEWESLPLVVVVTRRSGDSGPPHWLARRGAERILANRKYLVYRVAPARLVRSRTTRR
jgi:hypothetical protein